MIFSQSTGTRGRYWTKSPGSCARSWRATAALHWADPAGDNNGAVPETRGADVGAPRFEIMEATVAPTGPAFLVVTPGVRTEQDAAGFECRGEVAEDPGQLAARHME